MRCQKFKGESRCANQAGHIGALLKAHYERILYPLDVFEKEEAAKAKEEKELRKAALEKQLKEEKKVNTAKMSKAEKAEEDSKAFSKELQRCVGIFTDQISLYTYRTTELLLKSNLQRNYCFSF